MSRKKTNKSVTAPIADTPAAEPKKRFVFRVTEYEHTYLQVGDVFEFQGRDHVVVSVNATAARIVPVTEGTPKKVTFKPRFAEKEITFTAPERNSVVSVSANSEVTIKRRLGANWREKI